MMKAILNLKNQDGSVVVMAVLVLVLLTIIGMSAVNLSNTELQITTNSQVHKMAFYAAETGWQLHAQTLIGSDPSVTAIADLDANLTPDVTYHVEAGLQDEEYGKGWQTDLFLERQYVINSTGTAPRNATAQVTVGTMNIVKYRQYD